MKRFFIAVALTVACAPAFAQEVVGLQEAQTRRGPYLTNRLFDNIFISVAGGINIYEGENDSYGGKRLAPALDVAVGKYSERGTAFAVFGPESLRLDERPYHVRGRIGICRFEGNVP